MGWKVQTVPFNLTDNLYYGLFKNTTSWLGGGWSEGHGTEVIDVKEREAKEKVKGK